MKFFDPPKRVWWRRWLSRIPLLGRIWRIKVGEFKTLTFPICKAPPAPPMDYGPITKLNVPRTRIIEDNSLKDIRKIIVSNTVKSSEDIERSYRRVRKGKNL
jgi:hypothetical protein